MEGTLPVQVDHTPKRRWSRRRYVVAGLVLVLLAASAVAAFVLLRPFEPPLRQASPEIVALAKSFRYSDTVPDVVAGFAWSPDGKQIAASAVDALQIRDVGSEVPRRRTLPLAMTGNPMDIGGGVSTAGRVIWSPDGRLVALDVFNSLIPHLITLVETEDATIRHQIRVPIPPELPGKYAGDIEPFQMSGTHMLLGWADGGRSLVSLLGIEPGHDLSAVPGFPPPVPTTPPGGSVRPLPSSPEVTAAAIYCYVLDTETGELVRSVRVYSSTVSPSIYSLALSPDGDTLALAWLDGTVLPFTVPAQLNLDVWDLRSGKLKYSVNSLRIDPVKSYYGVQDQYLEWSPDGETIYLATEDTVKVIEAATGKITHTLPDVVPPPPTYVATATSPPNAFPPPGMPGPVSSAQPILPPGPLRDIFGRLFPQPAPGFPATPTPNPNQYDRIDGIKLSPSGDRLAVYAAYSIRVWDLTRRDPVMLTSIAGLPPHITGPVLGVVPADVSWAAGGRLLVSFVRNYGGFVWLIDPETGVHLGEMVPHAQEMASSPDGNKVAFLINGRLDIWASEGSVGPAESPTGHLAP